MITRLEGMFLHVMAHVLRWVYCVCISYTFTFVSIVICGIFCGNLKASKNCVILVFFNCSCMIIAGIIGMP